MGQIGPDVVLMDVVRRRMNGLQATRTIRQMYPRVQILILTVHQDEEYIRRILQAGASGYILKKAVAHQMISAIRALHRGEPFLDPSIAGAIMKAIARRREGISQGNAENNLTQREIEIVTLIANGHTNSEIADMLNISVKTVDTHRSNISAKIDIHNRVDLAKYAIRKGYVSLTDQ